eukprot:TRINITY_DN11000_c0_g1_i1.p1 TRINITY_DN11000_c0_g1~~TRINITY_DN11000_c0_g1_i1.p1  ORF type:complete len:316 (+),score=43.00 TRINITY_DN11000_c0_g1_i1:70-1017(+)
MMPSGNLVVLVWHLVCCSCLCWAEDAPPEGVELSSLTTQAFALHRRFSNSTVSLRRSLRLPVVGGAECDFECLGVGLATYYGCAAMCVKKFDSTSAVACITLGCPVVVAGTTEMCEVHNPACKGTIGKNESNDVARNEYAGVRELVVSSANDVRSSEALFAKAARVEQTLGGGAADALVAKILAPGSHNLMQEPPSLVTSLRTFFSEGQHKHVWDDVAPQKAAFPLLFSTIFENDPPRSSIGALPRHIPKCAIECTAAAAALYVGCLGVCIAEKRSLVCGFDICPIGMTAFDVGCLLKSCGLPPHNTTSIAELVV